MIILLIICLMSHLQLVYQVVTLWLQGNPYAQQGGPYSSATPRPGFPAGYGQSMPRPGSPAGTPLAAGQAEFRGTCAKNHASNVHAMTMCGRHCMRYITLHAVVLNGNYRTCYYHRCQMSRKLYMYTPLCMQYHACHYSTYGHLVCCVQPSNVKAYMLVTLHASILLASVIHAITVLANTIRLNTIHASIHLNTIRAACS